MSSQMEQGNLGVRLAAAERGLEADDPVAGLGRAAKGLPGLFQNLDQPAGQVGLGEELFRIEVGRWGVVLTHGPDVGREDRLIKPAFADVAMRAGYGVPGRERR